MAEGDRRRVTEEGGENCSAGAARDIISASPRHKTVTTRDMTGVGYASTIAIVSAQQLEALVCFGASGWTSAECGEVQWVGEDKRISYVTNWLKCHFPPHTPERVQMRHL